VKFHETFHDNGPTDMVRMLQIYGKGGFNAPSGGPRATIEGDANDRPGTAWAARFWPSAT